MQGIVFAWSDSDGCGQPSSTAGVSGSSPEGEQEPSVSPGHSDEEQAACLLVIFKQSCKSDLNSTEQYFAT